MSHILRPPSEKTFTIADALAGTPTCVVLLENAVGNLIGDFQNPDLRSQARETARALFGGCPVCGFKAASTALRKIVSLLAVPPQAAPELQQSIAEKLVDLVAVLKAQAQAGS